MLESVVARATDCGVPLERQTSVDPVDGVLVVDGNAVGVMTGGFGLAPGALGPEAPPPLPPPPHAAKIAIPRTAKPAARRALNFTVPLYPFYGFGGVSGSAGLSVSHRKPSAAVVARDWIPSRSPLNCKRLVRSRPASAMASHTKPTGFS